MVKKTNVVVLKEKAREAYFNEDSEKFQFINELVAAYTVIDELERRVAELSRILNVVTI